MPKRDLYDREQQRKQDSSTVLLQPISPRDMGLNEQKTDRILRRGESSEQKLTLSYTYDADSRSYQIRLNGKKPSDVVTDDQLKLIRKHDSFLSKISIDNIRNGSVNLLELKDNIPQPKEIDPTIFKGIEEISENKQSKGFHM
ncbi:hypothetical protein HPQ32_20490 [Photobacterium carnosum]|uniref:hypothetical protein n=1 Tax=Photobacterium carnosum TaxID=2023717 RepID=UPI001C90133C|nr:hypothetical protein [Photobacterium carnosum]MBY3790711.1 hypothetical protein [Photobacterium carnosum]MCD9535827.1 hypothetical protein [Photobacterium carnosum]